MKKYIIPIVLVVVFGFYLIFANSNNSSQTGITANQATSTGTTTDTSGTGSGATGTTPTGTTGAGSGTGTGSGTGSTGTGQTAAAFKDGTYTGQTEDAIYGKIQVVAVVKSGKITDVQVPVFPNDPGHTMEVNTEAIPVLKQEALQAQSSNVNAVSGATQTSQAFQQSLASALAQAKA